jgi:hypothetical protein
MIYYFNSAKFKYDQIKHMDLNNKTLVFVDSNTVQECSASGLGLDYLPHKLKSQLEKVLEKSIGTYNLDYMHNKRNMDPHLFESLLDREEDPVPFDYWRIREGFFEFCNELLGDYHKFLSESKMLGGTALGSKDLFDFPKYLKSKSSIKPKEFLQDFCGTNMFSRFIECRVLPESVSQEIYYNYFDRIAHLKTESPKQEYLNFYIQQLDLTTPLHCSLPDFQGLPVGMAWCYESRFPEWSPDLAVIPRGQPKIQSSGMSIDDHYDFLVPGFLTKASDEKWARANLEMLHTVWFLCLQIFLQSQAVPISIHLVNFAYNKFIEMEAEKINWNIQIVKSLSFCLAIFREVFKFRRVVEKAHKIIENQNQKMSVYAEYVKGLQIKPSKIDPKIKVQKFVKETPKDLMLSKSIDSQIEVVAADEDQRDDLIPTAVKSYFETNAFCSQCATYIPEEIILASMNKDPKKTRAKCPNQACLFEYEPVFSCKYLKEKGCREIQNSRHLLSPLRLFTLAREFLTSSSPQLLFSEHQSPDLYWNILFYGNLLNLPCFFIQDGLNPHLVEFSMHQLDYFVFEEKYGSGGSKTTINGISNNNESSFGENNHSMTISRDRRKLNTSAPGTKDGDKSTSVAAKFSFKKDL